MKYAVLIGDGMADYRLKALKFRTPVEAARTPNMDWIAAHGVIGLTSTIPKGMGPGSDVANLSIFGYNPAKHFRNVGRGPLEAAAMGLTLHRDDMAYRCNLVTIDIDSGEMIDHGCGDIESADARKIIEFIRRHMETGKIRFFPGVSYRHILLIRNGPPEPDIVGPHDILGKNSRKYLPRKKVLRDLVLRSQEMLRDCPVNERRIAKGKRPATSIWPWGSGGALRLPSFKSKFGLSGAVISAVDLIKGIGVSIGLEALDVPGATGTLDTNYKGKAEQALRALKKKDFVYVHVEAPDEASHHGDPKEKVEAIERFDRLTVGTILKGMKRFGEYAILVMPDHPTPIRTRTHAPDPVPFAVFSTSLEFTEEGRAFSEREAKKSSIRVKGHELMGKFLKNEF
ncbi:MAG: cofactor-independent phosphoglycerate mutase [Planctomycetes bacterium]|nr:cofactor-independent phosphoglycerate mutase [Planctomycetota bacterium]